MLHDPIHETVVGVHALMVAFESLPALVTSDSKGDTVFLAEFLELGHYAVSDHGDAFGVEAVHHCAEHFELVLDCVA